MATIVTNEGAGRPGNRKRRAKRHSTHIDMTPMVDLMSLLITFFMLTTAFTKPKIMDIILPDEGTSGESPAPRTLHLLLSGNNKVYYYVGKPPLNDKDLNEFVGRLQKTDYSKDGIRRTILEMNMSLFAKADSLRNDFIAGKSDISQDSLRNMIKALKKQDKLGPIVMIKADKKAKYRNIVDAVDEMEICNVARYAIVDPSDYELKLIEKMPQN